MKRNWLWQYTVSLLLLGMLLTSCGDTKTDEPGTAIPTPSSTSSAKSTSSTLGSTGTMPPQETCAAFLPATQCSQYSTVSGSTGGNDLPWVASGGVKAWLTSVNGELQLIVTTRCGPLAGQATIIGNTLSVGNIATGAMGCAEDVGEQHLWVMEFLKRPIELTFRQGTLSWKSGTDTLSFKSE